MIASLQAALAEPDRAIGLVVNLGTIAYVVYALSLRIIDRIRASKTGGVFGDDQSSIDTVLSVACSNDMILFVSYLFSKTLTIFGLAGLTFFNAVSLFSKGYIESAFENLVFYAIGAIFVWRTSDYAMFLHSVTQMRRAAFEAKFPTLKGKRW